MDTLFAFQASTVFVLHELHILRRIGDDLLNLLHYFFTVHAILANIFDGYCFSIFDPLDTEGIAVNRHDLNALTIIFEF